MTSLSAHSYGVPMIHLTKRNIRCRFGHQRRVYQVLLDGQQRLTTLYLLVNGELPYYYTEAELSADPRQLCFNLETREFQFF